MPVIYLTIVINAPIERCFDLSRSINLHQISTPGTNEKAIAGVTTGLVNKGDEITWRAKHFGIYQTLTSKITEMDSPRLFVDIQLSGAFKKMKHLHSFEKQGSQTIMTDVFEFESPLGSIGKLFNKLILTNYMKRFLTKRNQIIKETAESADWKKYINL